MLVVSATVVENIGIEAVVAVFVGLGCVVGGPVSHAIFVHVVLSGRIGSRRACERRSSRIAVEFVAELVGIVAIVGVLHFEDRFLAVLRQENLPILVLDVVLSGCRDGNE